MNKANAILVLIFITACNLPALQSDQTDSVTPLTTPLSPTQPVPAIIEKPIALDHQPLYWFAPLPPLSIHESRPFIGSEDFLALFREYAPWKNAAERIQVFKLYGEWVAYKATDEELRIVVNDLKRRGLALAVEAGPLNASPECGQNVEGFAGIEEGKLIANRIRKAGGTIHLIGMDEPYYYGHFYNGPNACHWPAEKIAAQINNYINEIRKVFPEVAVGDTEALSDSADAKAYQDWMDIFRQVNGYDLAFLHMDIDWTRPNWSDEVKSIEEHGRRIGVPVGIIYTGNFVDITDEEWLGAAGERVKKHELANGGNPDHVLFQSWNDKPDRSLPDSEPFTFTGFINLYFEEKSKLGFPREGSGANLALEKPVRASNVLGDSPGALAVDGDAGTLWSSGGFAAQWIEIDLGAEYNIGEIRLIPSQYPPGRTVHLIKGKGVGAGDAFVLLHTFDGETNDGDRLIFTPETPFEGIRYIRIETTVSPSWVAWREIVVIASGQ